MQNLYNNTKIFNFSKFTIKLLVVMLLIHQGLFSQKLDEVYLIDNLKTLSSSEFQGRKPGTESFKISEKFVSDKLREIGLKEITPNYQQEFDFCKGYKFDESTSLSFNVIVPKLGVPIEKIKPRINMLTSGTDWYPSSLSANGNFDGEVAFLGYGITAKDLDYDDYAGIDVTNKAVIVLTNSPDGESRTGKFNPFSRYSYKIKNALDHGAKAIIFVKIQGDSANVFKPLEFMEYGDAPQLIAMQANRATISKYFPSTAQLQPIEQKINSTKKPNSFILPNTTISMKVNLMKEMTKTSNIVGYLEGTDSELKNEVMVIGAHYDHLGLGAMNSADPNPYGKIHHGADDNASGTAALLTLAKYLKDNPTKRSIMFVFFSAEESGLLGSKYFVTTDMMTKYKIVNMLNIDMIGRYKDELQVGGIGTDNIFKEVLEKLNEMYKFKLNLVNSGKGPSDHQSFYLKNIPVLFFFTGIHEDYHTPKDTFEKIKKVDYSKISNFILDVINNFGNTDSKFEFKIAD